MKKVLDFIVDKKLLFIGILCALLISMTIKTQVVIVTYGDDYTLKLEYTVYGYCVRASAARKATEPAVYNEMYFGNSIDNSVLKAVKQMEILADEKQNVGIQAMGVPKNTDKLEEHLISLLTEKGYSAGPIDTKKENS